MSFGFQIEPLPAWGRPETASRKPSTFRTEYNDTLKLLRDELRLLGAEGPIVIGVVTTRADIRQDGALRAQATVSHPGVQVSATTKHGPMTWATDRYKTTYYNQGDSWRANLHAIALSLTALRAVDRYGTTSTGEQYTGFKAIGSTAAPNVSVDDAEALIRSYAARVPAARYTDPLTSLFRAAQAATHPDRGHDRAEWDAVEAAGATLRAAGVL